MIIAIISLSIATLLTAFGVAEISFPETFLTITDKDWFLEIFPTAWKYNIYIGVSAIIIA